MSGHARAVVDKRVCVSSTRCMAVEPDAFRFDDQGLTEATGAPLPADRLVEAALHCPVRAISVQVDGVEVALE